MKSKMILSLIVSFGVLFSCDDVLLKDLSKDKVLLRSPTDNYSTTTASQTLWWEAIDGASTYNLTIASPSLDSANVIALDTIISKTNFTATFSVGKAQWCVRAINSGYETDYSCRSIEITK